MKIDYGPIVTKVVEATTLEWDQIRSALASPEGEDMVRPDGAIWSGLVGRLVDAGLSVEGLPEPDSTWADWTPPPDFLEGVELRDYQVDAVRAVMTQRRGLIAQPTGSGKTEVAAALIKLIGSPSIIICDTINAAAQLAKRLKERGIEGVKMLGGGRRTIGDHNVCVSNTAYSKTCKKNKAFLELLNTAKLFAVDEAHHMGSSRTWLVAAAHCPAPYRVGLSATPFAPEFSVTDLALVGALGEVIHRVPSKVLRDRGVLAEPVVFLVHVDGGARVNPRIKNWHQIENQAIVEHDYRNALITTICHSVLRHEPDARILLLVRRINHGIFFVTALNSMRISARFSFGSKRLYTEDVTLHTRSYEDVKTEFEEGEFSVLVGSTVFNESADMPTVTDLILAPAGRHPRPLLQRLGRGMRIAPGKDHVRVWDFWDAQHWATKHQSSARLRVYDAEKIAVVNDYTTIASIVRGELSPREAVARVRGGPS